MRKPYLIAELGVNFYDTASIENISPYEAAKKYVKIAKESGVDAVKFQSYKANTIVSKCAPAYWDITKNPIDTQHKLFQQFDHFNEEDYGNLCEYCHEIGVDFMSTPFDYNSADYLFDMVDKYKISSSDITNLPFIKYIASKGKPIYLSVGASYMSEIAEAVEVIMKAGCPELCLFHCVLSYPTKNEDANLKKISRLKVAFPECTIGYSDHTLPDDCMSILSTAFMLGADVIEKHFTLDKSLKGNDHFHAGDPSDFSKARNNFELINTILGDEKLEVLPCEEVPRREARRSIVLTRDMKKGEIISSNDIMEKRPGTGIAPKYRDIVIGRAVNRDLSEDMVLTWDML